LFQKIIRKIFHILFVRNYNAVSGSGYGARAQESGAGRSQHRILGGSAAENHKHLRFIRQHVCVEILKFPNKL